MYKFKFSHRYIVFMLITVAIVFVTSFFNQTKRISEMWLNSLRPLHCSLKLNQCHYSEKGINISLCRVNEKSWQVVVQTDESLLYEIDRVDWRVMNNKDLKPLIEKTFNYTHTTTNIENHCMKAKESLSNWHLFLAENRIYPLSNDKKKATPVQVQATTDVRVYIWLSNKTNIFEIPLLLN